MEIGAGQADAVSALAGAGGLGSIAVAPDLAGIGRVVSARRDRRRQPMTATQ